MKKYVLLYFWLLSGFIFYSCLSNESLKNDLSVEIVPEDIEFHIDFLAGDALEGRETGTPGAAKAANHIADHFEVFGLLPMDESKNYFQEFIVDMSTLNNPHRTDSTGFSDEERIARNIVGMVQGAEYPRKYIVTGAHYDHLGMGRFGSLSNRKDLQIHNGADDNASGTAGLLELAHYFAHNKPQKSLIFAAFSGEELGLLGSRYFVENAPVPLDQIEAMINMDMIGRLKENKLLIFGAGSSDSWDSLIETSNVDSIQIETIPDGTGASDHASFYNKKIPVLHYFTHTHADYHRPSDDTEYINFEGEDKVLEHIKRVIEQIDTLSAGQPAYTE